jgi:hypothetical protein
MQEAKSRIEDLKAKKQYDGEEKEAADFAYVNSMEWHNELLSESKLSSEEALEWKSSAESKVEKLAKQVENSPSAVLDRKLKAAQEELEDANANFNSTWAGQEELKSLMASTKDLNARKALERRLTEGAALHAKQIIATALVDRKRQGSDLPIKVSNAIDLSVLSAEEKQEYSDWIEAVRFDKNQVTNKELIMNQTFTSVYKRVNDSETGTEWRIKPNPKHKGWRVPAYVSKALYVMPNSTDRISIINFNFKEAYKQLKKSKNQNNVDSKEYQAWAELKYDADRIKRFLK